MDAGWSVHGTPDPRKAEQIFRQDREIAVTITGIRLSDTDGFSLLRKLRGAGSQPRMFAPILTARSVDLNVAMNAIEHRVSAIVPVPVSPSVLKLKVSEAWSSLTGIAPAAEAAAVRYPDAHAGHRQQDHHAPDTLNHPWSAIATAVARETCNRILERVGSMFSEAAGFSEAAAGESALPAPPPPPDDKPQKIIDRTAQPMDLLRGIMKVKRKYFPEPLFGDPCWEMLFDLGVSHMEDKSVSVSSLCIASGIPQTTALRRIADLENIGLVKRSKDPDDGRRIYVRLTEVGLERFFGFLQGFSDQMDRHVQPPAAWTLLQRRHELPQAAKSPH